MEWIKDFQLFLFDFDGLLVNTEHLHYQAYADMVRGEGFPFDWSFQQFCEVAHLNSTALKAALYRDFPNLDPDWKRLYEKKAALYLELLSSGKVELMEGVEPLLRALEKKQIRRCVVTNSRLEQIQMIRAGLPALQTIPHWVTRELYSNPKPDPECYLKAIALYGQKGDRIIGFEDSIRGLQALQQTPALPVLICPSHHPLLGMAIEGGALHFESIASINF